MAQQRSGRGFAALPTSELRRISSAGGRASHESGHGHEWTSQEAREAGKRGGRLHADNAHEQGAGENADEPYRQSRSESDAGSARDDQGRFQANVDRRGEDATVYRSSEEGRDSRGDNQSVERSDGGRDRTDDRLAVNSRSGN